MKRRIRIAGATVIVAAGLIGAVLAPASAAKPANYGTCVTIGEVNPADGTSGPDNLQGRDSSFEGRGGGVFTGIGHSGGKPRFSAGLACAVF
jgi:hypothetical protein